MLFEVMRREFVDRMVGESHVIWLLWDLRHGGGGGGGGGHELAGCHDNWLWFCKQSRDHIFA